MGKSNKTKIVVFVIVTLILLLGLAAGGIWYHISHPEVYVTISVQDADPRFEEGYHMEYFMMTWGENDRIPPAKNVQQVLDQVLSWCHETETDIHDHFIAPLNITASGKVEQGKTILSYEGTVTTPEGLTQDYKKELTLDYLFSADNHVSGNIFAD